MVRGLYIAGTGMLLQRRHMDIVTNNVANVETTGFKKEMLVSHTFSDVMVRRINDNRVLGQSPTVGPLNLGTQVDQKYIDFSQGNFEATERNTDLALVGDAFFVISTPEGDRYTQAGAFYVDDQGFLVDGSGNFLLGENGPINVGGLNFSVNTQGQVFTADGQLIDTIQIVSFADNNTLRKQGNSLFFATEPPIAPNPFQIRQGILEASNVDIAREMVDMVTVFRAYQLNQQMLTMIDETVGRAVNDIGRLR
jgi:flagellar basal-body rod protein FlgG